MFNKFSISLLTGAIVLLAGLTTAHAGEMPAPEPSPYGGVFVTAEAVDCRIPSETGSCMPLAGATLEVTDGTRTKSRATRADGVATVAFGTNVFPGTLTVKVNGQEMPAVFYQESDEYFRVYFDASTQPPGAGYPNRVFLPWTPNE